MAKGRPLLPVFEAVSNAIDAITDAGGRGQITIKVDRLTELDGSRGEVTGFVVEDDGVGFTFDNARSFGRLFSDWKRSRGGKGRGRFTYLKVFYDVSIETQFEEEGNLRRRAFVFDVGFTECPASIDPIGDWRGTRTTLSNMKADFSKNVPRNPDTLARDFIAHFMPLMLSEREIEITLVDGIEIPLRKMVRDEFMISMRPDTFRIGARDFSIRHVRMRPRAGVKHKLILAAGQREVDSTNLERDIPVLASGAIQMAGEESGFFSLAVVEGAYLDEIVDPMRVGFGDSEHLLGNEEEGEGKGDLFGEPTSIGQIRSEAIAKVRRELEPALAAALDERQKALELYIRGDGLGYHFLKKELPEVAKRLRSTDDATIESVLHEAAYEERLKRQQEARVLLNATPKERREGAYFERWQKTVDGLSDVAKSDLANHVAHRRAILDLIQDVLRTTPEGDHRREEVIHSIIFPRGRQSGEVSSEQQNLWVIDERLSFHEHLYSDLTIKTITGGDVDSLRRPDLTIFESGFASFHDGGNPPAQIVLLELKRPGREDASKDDPVSATLDYVEKLKAGRARTEGNAVIDVQQNALTTVYLLTDWTADFLKYLKREQFRAMPGDVGQQMYRPEENILFIAIPFARLVEGARRRNRIFFQKLGIV